MQYFAALLREHSRGGLEIEFFPDGELGQEVQLIEQLQAGKLDFVKASASVVERFGPAYRVFSLPYVFRDREHWKAVATNVTGETILASTAANGLVGLTFYEAGSRSFYGQKAFHHPDDLKGLKIRIQPSPTMSRLMQAFGAEGVQLAWEFVYNALRTGLVDGAENNVSALIVGRHGEVVRHFTLNEHTMVPDVFLISAARWSILSLAQQTAIREAALASHHRMNELWAQFEAGARRAGEAMNVDFTHPDKKPFIERAAAIKREFAADQMMRDLIKQIERA